MRKENKNITVIVITLNRPEKLINLLKSLLMCTFKDFEIIIVDESSKRKINIEINNLLNKFSKFTYVKYPHKGKSKGLNHAIKISSSPILAFTDDDCIVDKNWLTNINKAFIKHPKISGIFGSTLPYLPNSKKGYICPCTFNKMGEGFIKKPCKHWEQIGFGNNMSFRKNVFLNMGYFKEWLGPGSFGSNAEDAEFALRCLLNNHILYYQPKCLIYHDRWLNNVEYQKQRLSYICGEISCYGYLAFQGYNIGKIVIRSNLKDTFSDIKKLIKSLIYFKSDAFEKLYWLIITILTKLKGIIIAFLAYMIFVFFKIE